MPAPTASDAVGSTGPDHREGRLRARVVAFHLPQFHPTLENDEWWGPGFTEWTNVAKMRPMFRGHRQPVLPGELGFYDLRLPETRAAQADLARTHGISAFCYWHYWFGGRRMLERPVDEVVASGEPDFPFCLGWANHSWTGVWHGSPDRTLIAQTYPGARDHDAHLDALLPALGDQRYFTVDGLPLFFVMRPQDIPDAARVADRWRERARAAGLPGLFIVGQQRAVAPLEGFDATMTTRPLPQAVARPLHRRLRRRLLRRPTIHRYDEVWERFVPPAVEGVRDYPCLFPNWDNTPRSGWRGVVLQGADPDGFRCQVRRAIDRMADRPFEDRLVFVKSWNEWAEGNHLEPDREHGRGWLEAVRKEVVVGEGRPR
jgi:lipopolysaccharide biosynthesis protein